MDFKHLIDRIDWVTSIFLIATALMAVTAVPVYIWHCGISGLEAGLFLFYFIATGLSITLGYHRLFSHIAFKASWPVRLFTLLFGASAFENSVLDWASDHRMHHKHVDEDQDPYNINKGFLYAHIGWLFFKVTPENNHHNNVPDLKKDPLVMWQHRYCHRIGAIVGFVIPTLIGYWHAGPMGALGCFLIPGILRLVFVQHMTFFINSLAHCAGKQPYDGHCTARDNPWIALLTFGEGYHNYHHTFQHDYRNGVKPWQFDPTKWCIWLLSKLGLASQLRRVPDEKILLAELRETQRRLEYVLQASAQQPVQASLQGTSDASRSALAQLCMLEPYAAKMASYRTQLEACIEGRSTASKDFMRTCRQDLAELDRQLSALRFKALAPSNRAEYLSAV
jgi:stearoyl-CoA desaturase (delta-9 desaturase)